MEPDQAGGDYPEPLPYKIWALRVSIHCAGCKKKVKKILQSIEGVYKIEIDSKQHKVTVTGDVEAEVLVKKLTKSGKLAEIWTDESGGGGDDQKKFDESQNTTRDNGNEKEGDDSSGEDNTEGKGGAPPVGGGEGTGGKKKKKKKKKKKGNSGQANGGGPPGGGPPGGGPPGGGPPGGGPPPETGIMGPPVDDQMYQNPPRQYGFSYPQYHYAAPEYGMSYNTGPPITASYYTLPMHSYTYSRPLYYPLSDSIVDVDRRDDELGCSIF